MTLLVDSRIGSKDLCRPLQQAGFDAELTTLEFGDVCFVGKGEKGTTLDIGIELKNIGDLVGSLRSGRLAGHQLPGLLATYDHSWLIIEGLWRHDEHGQLVIFKGARNWRPLPGRMSASELEKQVLTLELCGGLHVRYTSSRRDTLRFIGCLYHWFVDVPFDGHKSHLAVHRTPSLVPLSPFRQAVAQWPDIGIKTSLVVETHFQGSIRRAANASIEEWKDITTLDAHGKARRLGVKVAERIVAFCRGEQ